MKEIGARLAVDAGQIRRAPRRHASDKKLSQSILRLFLQTTATYPHPLILDPLGIWDSPIKIDRPAIGVQSGEARAQ
jgi:hypothetical protein